MSGLAPLSTQITRAAGRHGIALNMPGRIAERLNLLPDACVWFGIDYNSPKEKAYILIDSAHCDFMVALYGASARVSQSKVYEDGAGDAYKLIRQKSAKGYDELARTTFYSPDSSVPNDPEPEEAPIAPTLSVGTSRRINMC